MVTSYDTIPNTTLEHDFRRAASHDCGGRVLPRRAAGLPRRLPHSGLVGSGTRDRGDLWSAGTTASYGAGVLVTMNLFDSTIIDFINHFSRLSWTFDFTVNFISENHLVKGGVLLTIFWWGWFKVSKNQAYVRVHMISTLFSCFIAMILARALALSLPFRLRPLHEENLDFLLPYGMRPTTLEDWSAFPSDHAVLFYALSTGMFLYQRKLE